MIDASPLQLGAFTPVDREILLGISQRTRWPGDRPRRLFECTVIQEGNRDHGRCWELRGKIRDSQGAV